MNDSFELKKLLADKIGQTMIEVVVALGIAAVIIGSLVSLINASTRRATLARQSTQASKLAQEGMEIVRNIRDTDVPGAIRIGIDPLGLLCNTYPAVSCQFSSLYNKTQGNLTGHLSNPTLCGIGSWCLIAGGFEPISLDTASFKRTVDITDNADLFVDTDDDGTADKWVICSGVVGGAASNVKRITVTVSWTSPIGDQKRTVVSCLTNWR